MLSEFEQISIKEIVLREGLGVDETTISRIHLKERSISTSNLIDATQDRDHPKALFNTGLNIRVQ